MLKRVSVMIPRKENPERFHKKSIGQDTTKTESVRFHSTWVKKPKLVVEDTAVTA